MSSVKTSDVTGFIKDMVELTMVYEVDPEGYVIEKKSGDRITKSDGGNQCPLLIYQEVIKDQSALIINPLAEGLGSTPSSLWFYDVMKTAILGRFFTLIVLILKTALDEKRSKTDKDGHISMELINHVAPIIEGVDERLLQEFMSMIEDKENNGEFITIYYQRKQLRSVLRCSLFDEDDVAGIPTWKSKFPKTRQKTWPILQTIMLSLLNMKDSDEISKFTKKADVISCARLSSFLNVMLAVYQEINPLLDAVNPDIAVDLSKLAFHLNRLSAYADNAKFFVQPGRGTSAPAQQQQATIPGVVSAVPMAMPAFPQVPSPTQMPGVSLVPGPVYADGRPSAPIPVQNGVGFQPGFVPNGQPQMMPAGFGYIQPQQQPQFGYNQSPQQFGVPQNIPFDGPYVQSPPNYMSGVGNFGNINILPPGAPSGFNPNYR